MFFFFQLAARLRRRNYPLTVAASSGSAPSPGDRFIDLTDTPSPSLAFLLDENNKRTRMNQHVNYLPAAVLLLACFWSAPSVQGAPQDLGSPIRIAQCRALCLDKVNFHFVSSAFSTFFFDDPLVPAVEHVSRRLPSLNRHPHHEADR